MNTKLFVVFCGALFFLQAFDPRVTALSVANKAKGAADAILQASNKGLAELLQGRHYQAIRDDLLANQRALQKAVDEVIDSSDAVALATKRAQLAILKATQDALVQKLRQQRFPLDALNKLIALLDAQFPALGKILDALDVRESIIRGYSSLVDQVTMEGLNRDNPYRNAIVQPEPSTTLRGEEIAFRQARDQKALPAMQKIFGSDKPRIAFVATGGGYRAMYLTQGYLMGLEAAGWLDTIYYISSLSGSTWFLAPWMYNQSPRVADYTTLMRRKIAHNEMNVLALNDLLQNGMPLVLNNVLWPKAVFLQPIGTVDIYGALLAEKLFSQFGEQRQSMRLSSQWEFVKDGSRPFPIYTAIGHNSTAPSGYDWYEFNPIALTNLSQKLRIPAYAFGSQFREGKSVLVAPEQSMGYFLGMFGSAYAVNIQQDIYTRFLRRAKESVTTLGAIKEKVMALAFKGIEVSGIGRLRALPADNYNPFKGYRGASEKMRTQEILTLVDAGLDYNIPIMPVLDPARGINVVIVGDSSKSSNPFKRMFDDIKRVYGYEYQRIDSAQEVNFALYKAPQPSAPLIIYVSYFDDPKALEKMQENPLLHTMIKEYDLASFNAEKCFKGECRTLNFDYSVQTYDQVVGIASLYMHYSLPAIKRAISEFFKQ